MATGRKQESRQPGLPSLNQARQDRKRSVVLGRARVYGGSPQFWMWTFLGLSVFVVIYWKFAQGELASMKGAVMAKQRAVSKTLGPKIIPFRDKIEAWVIELARNGGEDHVSDKADLDAIARAPGVYLRLRRKHAKDVTSIREAAHRSLRDGFTSCLFVRKEVSEGEPCDLSSECHPGELCNDWKVCARPSQPFNLRLAYRALRVLEPEWTDELHQAPTDLSVRAFELDLESVTRNDVPIAAQILAGARYFTVVLDDEPLEGLGDKAKGVRDDAGTAAPGLDETPEERLHRTPHRAQVGIWDLRTGELLARVRGLAAGSFMPVGDQGPQPARLVAAQERQVNSCALALSVKKAIQEAGSNKDEAGGGTAAGPDGGASGQAGDN